MASRPLGTWHSRDMWARAPSGLRNSTSMWDSWWDVLSAPSPSVGGGAHPCHSAARPRCSHQPPGLPQNLPPLCLSRVWEGIFPRSLSPHLPADTPTILFPSYTPTSVALMVFTPATFNFSFLQKGLNCLLWPRHLKDHKTWLYFPERRKGNVFSFLCEWLHNNEKRWATNLSVIRYGSSCHGVQWMLTRLHSLLFSS